MVLKTPRMNDHALHTLILLKQNGSADLHSIFNTSNLLSMTSTLSIDNQSTILPFQKANAPSVACDKLLYHCCLDQAFDQPPSVDWRKA